MELHHNAAVLGATQTGKTTTALRLLQAQQGIKLFINTKREAKWFRPKSMDPSFSPCIKYQVTDAEDMFRVYKYYNAFSNGIGMFVPSATNKRKALPELEKILEVVLQYHQDNIVDADKNMIRSTILVD